jgi:hypothetical protein
MRQLQLSTRILRLLAALLFPLFLMVGVSCNAPAIGDFFHPLPPPDPTFGPPTPEIDSAGVTHIYWQVTSPASAELSDVWVYLTNIGLGRGVSVQAAQDGSYTTRIEGQQGDRILFGFGAPYDETNQTMCRPLREGLADAACQ